MQPDGLTSMKILNVFLACSLAGFSGCMRASSDERISDVFNAYNTGNYVVAFEKLAQISKPGNPTTLDFWAAKIYATNAYWTKNKKMASRAITYLDEMSKNTGLDLEAKIYINYLYAISYDVLGNVKEAHIYLSKNCLSHFPTEKFKCQMIKQVVAGSFENLDFEFDYAISDCAMKYGYNDPLLPAIQISSLVFRDYRMGHALKQEYIHNNKFTKALGQLYCDSVSKRYSVTKLFSDDKVDCGISASKSPS